MSQGHRALKDLDCDPAKLACVFMVVPGRCEDERRCTGMHEHDVNDSDAF